MSNDRRFRHVDDNKPFVSGVENVEHDEAIGVYLDSVLESLGVTSKIKNAAKIGEIYIFETHSPVIHTKFEDAGWDIFIGEYGIGSCIYQIRRRFTAAQDDIDGAIRD